MKYKEIMKLAKGQLGGLCLACPVCDGRACANSIPGPGSKPPGNVALRNYQKWQELCINMDTLVRDAPIDTSVDIFGKTLDFPVMAAPIGGLKLHYGEKYTDEEYNDILVKVCAENGIAAMVGDSVITENYANMIGAIGAAGGVGIPTIKPWNPDAVFRRIDIAKQMKSFACAMDIDGAGLPFLKQYNSDAGAKSVAELKEIVDYADMPFILKGIMTPNSAIKAAEAGVSAIVVSNHGGRVLGQVPSTCEVLPKIAQAVKGKLTIIVDGGIRSGIDVFKALALGADCVLIGRPFVPVIYGAGSEGAKDYLAQLKSELVDTMTMCGARSISDICPEMLWK